MKYTYNIFRITFLALMFFNLLSCKKKKEPDTNVSQIQWEIVRNFHQDDSYDGATIVAHNGEVFFSTYGHSGIGPGSSGSLANNMKATFFYKINADWYKYGTTDEAIIHFKVFKDSLYGIRLLKKIKSTQPVMQYNYSYVLFKWENNNFSDIDILEFTDDNHIEKSNIGNVLLWENAGKLYLFGTTADLCRVWALENNKLVYQNLEQNMFNAHAIGVDNKDVAFTQINQLSHGEDRTEYRVRGHYFNGNTFSTGKEYSFVRENGINEFETSNYVAAKNSLWGSGFEKNKFKNYDTEQIVSGMSKGTAIRGDIVIGDKGKYYFMAGNEQIPSGCESLVVFDGLKLKEYAFGLPAQIDPCSRLIYATEESGTIYLLLKNRFQYVIVKGN